MNIEHMALNVPDPGAHGRVVRAAPRHACHPQAGAAPFTHFIADESGRVVLELYHHVKAVIPDYAKLDPLSLHLAFISADVAGERQRLIAAGATPAGDIVTTESGDVMTFVRDPWNVTVQLVKRLKPMM